MSSANLPACFTSENLKTYRNQVLQNLSEIQTTRRNSPTAYPESVCAILAAVTTPKTLDKQGRPLPPDCQPNPVSLWIADRCKQHAEVADRAWRTYVRKARINLSKISSETQGLMAQERSWRFWSQFALITAEIFSGKGFLQIPQTTADALAEFIAGATMIRNAINTLVKDPWILRALPAQELPVLQQLEGSLPSLIETFETTDARDWYDFRYPPWLRVTAAY